MMVALKMWVSEAVEPHNHELKEMVHILVLP
jgi:hypothetical protein